jgi:hypothetical protein
MCEMDLLILGGGGAGLQEPQDFRGFPGVLCGSRFSRQDYEGVFRDHFTSWAWDGRKSGNGGRSVTVRVNSHPVFLFRGVNVWTDNTSRVSPRAWLRAPACFRWQTTRLPQTLQVSQVLVRRVPHPFHVTAGRAGRLAEQHFPKGPAEI